MNEEFNSDNVSTDVDEKFYIELRNVKKEKVYFTVSKDQADLFKSRYARSFFIRCPKEKILQEIDNASNCTQLEELARKYYMCDCCDFAEINLYAAKRTLKVVADVMYKYPQLRGYLCYIGTRDALENRLKKLEDGDMSVLTDFGLQYIFTEEQGKKLGKIYRERVSVNEQEPTSSYASIYYLSRLFDALLLDKSYFDGYAYLRCADCVRRDESTGFHPKGCYTPELILYHELGHLLNLLCDLSCQKSFKEYYNALTRADIENGLSQYAAKSVAEFIAEAFAEYMCNPAPRPIATKVVELLNESYQKQFPSPRRA